MANIESQKKRNRQNEVRRVANKSVKSDLKTAIKKVMQAEDATAAQAALSETSGLLDRLASRRLIHPNKAARKKSQLARLVAQLG